LELAARIGQKLLADNQTLRGHNEYLEEQLLQATDKVASTNDQSHNDINHNHNNGLGFCTLDLFFVV